MTDGRDGDQLVAGRANFFLAALTRLSMNAPIFFFERAGLYIPG